MKVQLRYVNLWLDLCEEHCVEWVAISDVVQFVAFGDREIGISDPQVIFGTREAWLWLKEQIIAEASKDGEA